MTSPRGVKGLNFKYYQEFAKFTQKLHHIFSRGDKRLTSGKQKPLKFDDKFNSKTCFLKSQAMKLIFFCNRLTQFKSILIFANANIQNGKMI